MLHTQYTPPTITFYERRQFHLARKLAEESVAAWFARVKKASAQLHFWTASGSICSRQVHRGNVQRAV